MAKSRRDDGVPRRCACGAPGPGAGRALTALLRWCVEGTASIGLYAMTPDEEAIRAVRGWVRERRDSSAAPCCTGALPDGLRAGWIPSDAPQRTGEADR
jgi:hypothetical protein